MENTEVPLVNMTMICLPVVCACGIQAPQIARLLGPKMRGQQKDDEGRR